MPPMPLMILSKKQHVLFFNLILFRSWRGSRVSWLVAPWTNLCLNVTKNASMELQIKWKANPKIRQDFLSQRPSRQRILGIFATHTLTVGLQQQNIFMQMPHPNITNWYGLNWITVFPEIPPLHRISNQKIPSAKCCSGKRSNLFVSLITKDVDKFSQKDLFNTSSNFLKGSSFSIAPPWSWSKNLSQVGQLIFFANKTKHVVFLFAMSVCFFCWASIFLRGQNLCFFG